MSSTLGRERLVRNVVRLRNAERLSPAREEIAAVRRDLESTIGPTLPRAMAARLLGVSQTALDGWIGRGEVPAVITSTGRREVPRTVLVDLMTAMQEDELSLERNRLASVLRHRRSQEQRLDPDVILPRRYLRGQDPHGHRRAELIALAYHRALAQRLDEQLVGEARQRLAEWRAEGKIDRRYADQWADLLSSSLQRLKRVIARDDQRSRDLRQNSPFSGCLREPERRQILDMVG